MLKILPKSVGVIRSIPGASVALRSLSTTCPCRNQLQVEEEQRTNEEIVPVKNFVNRNPRNLERLSLAHRDRGWGFGQNAPGVNHPLRFYHHRIHVDKSGKYVTVSLEHYHGRVVLSASTREWRIRKHLYKGNDVVSHKHVGRILAERCLRAGVSCAAFHRPTKTDPSPSTQALIDGLQENGFVLHEPSPVKFGYTRPHWKYPGPAPQPLEGASER